jgi:hypothetical protein
LFSELFVGPGEIDVFWAIRTLNLLAKSLFSEQEIYHFEVDPLQSKRTGAAER